MSEEKTPTINETVLAANVAAAEKRERRRFWKRLICGVVLGVIALLALAFIFRDQLIEIGVRRIGSFIVGTPVEIADFNSSLDGRIELLDITVGNPKGYLKPHAFKIQRIYVKLDVGTLTGNRPVVENVEVSGVAVNFEAKPDGSSNLTDIQNNLKKFAGEESGAPADDGNQPESSGSSPLIKQLSMTGMTVSIASAALNSAVPLPLPPVYLSNLGGDRPLGKTLLAVYDGLLNSVGTVSGGLAKGIGTVTGTGKAVGGVLNKAVKLVKPKK